MSESDTPRTDTMQMDALDSNDVRAWTSFARQLERELQEARRDAERLRFVLSASGDMTLRIHNTRPDLRLAAIDSAMASDPPAS